MWIKDRTEYENKESIKQNNLNVECMPANLARYKYLDESTPGMRTSQIGGLGIHKCTIYITNIYYSYFSTGKLWLTEPFPCHDDVSSTNNCICREWYKPPQFKCLFSNCRWTHKAISDDLSIYLSEVVMHHQ